MRCVLVDGLITGEDGDFDPMIRIHDGEGDPVYATDADRLAGRIHDWPYPFTPTEMANAVGEYGAARERFTDEVARLKSRGGTEHDRERALEILDLPDRRLRAFAAQIERARESQR